MKDDYFFKWQYGKRQGLVCRQCDLLKKKKIYQDDAVVRQSAIERASKRYAEKRPEILIHAKIFRALNVEKVKRRKAADHARNRVSNIERSRKWVSENKERHTATVRAYAEKHREKFSSLRAAEYQKHKAYYKAVNKQWWKENPHMNTFYSRTYQADALKRTPQWADLKKMRTFYADKPYGFDVDHVIPLRGKLVSGLHVENNLQYLTHSENCKKSNKFNPRDHERYYPTT